MDFNLRTCLQVLALLCLLAPLSQGYATQPPDFSREPPTTLPPLTAEQQLYVQMLNILNDNPPGGDNGARESFFGNMQTQL